MDPLHQEDYKGYKIRIEHDDNFIESGSNDEHFGHMIFFHRKYNFGDDHKFTPETLKQFIQKQGVVSLPVYMYDHSGITIRTYPFSCPWDSGQIGYIYATADDIKENYNVKKVREHHRVKAEKLLEQEIEHLDHILRGDVYGYIVEKEVVKCESCKETELEHIDSCWGFVGEFDYCLNEVRSVVDNLTKEKKNG
jgi:hypothetical protein